MARRAARPAARWFLTPSALLLALPTLLLAAAAPVAGGMNGDDRPGGVEVLPVTDRVVMIHFIDGSVVYETKADPDGAKLVDVTPLDAAAAARPEAYTITSGDDPAWAAGLHPEKVGRKSKGRDFISAGGKISHLNEHWLYLRLPVPMKAGRTYAVATAVPPARAPGGSGPGPLTLKFDAARSRSEAIHVNQVGYVPSAPQKFAYLSHWMGDLGPLPLDDRGGARFMLIDQATGKAAFTGTVAPRKKKDEPETAQTGDAPGTRGNFVGADVWEMDFSAFRTPGTYVVSVEGVGCSYPFAVGDDVYRPAFLAAARALYHQRCGTALEARYTRWPRPACHRPDDEHPLKQSKDRYLDHPHDDGDSGADRNLTGETRNGCWGGWHDAGDWDREPWHLDASSALLLAYECAPHKFRDGEQGIPESGNGIPDLVDEARWGVDYYRRLQRPDGGVSVGLFESTYPQGVITSDTDPMKWYLYAEDPAQTYRYAAAACRLAWCLRLAGHGDLAGPYVETARRAYDWAGKNTRAGDEAKVKNPTLSDLRFDAAAALYKATGGKAFHEEFKKLLKVATADTLLATWDEFDQHWGAWDYATTDRPDVDAALKDRLVKASLHYAQVECLDPAARRAGRFGYNWYAPLMYGSATVPRTLPLMVAWRLSHEEKFLAAQYTTCDYMLGGNPLNMTWVTGVGSRSPRQLMRWDSWYNANRETVPGIVPMGPHRYEAGNAPGPWDVRYLQQTCYPDAGGWPPHELWSEDRLCPPTNEFTVGTIAEAAAAYGVLCADRR